MDDAIYQVILPHVGQVVDLGDGGPIDAAKYFVAMGEASAGLGDGGGATEGLSKKNWD